MTFSRIVILYNQWQHLRWLADDALFTPEVEYVLVDDRSTDPLPPDVAAALARRGLRLHTLPQNRGRSVARNHGAALAQGRWLDFIDGDDLPLPLRAEPSWADADVVSFPFRMHGDIAAETGPAVHNQLLADSRASGGFLDPRPAAVLWRRDAFHALGGFDTRAEPVEDLDLLLRARTRARGFATYPKQSYNEQTRPTLKVLETTAALIRLFRQLPPDEPLRQSLIDQQVANLHLLSTWHQFDRHEHRRLFRSAVATLLNVIKARLGLGPRPPARQP